ncbi:MAG TPA: MFS transporter [Nocardioidaceae bacterium]|nr:MFS transporter [Nocardioidaceae bacterium]
MGLHRPVRGLLHRRVPAVPCPAPGVPGSQGERPRRHRRRTPQPLTGHRRRVAARHRRQPPVRPAQRPHHVQGGNAAALDGDGVAVGAAGALVVATAPNIATVLVGWCVCQVFFNATLAAQAAVLPDQVPSQQRGLVSGLLGLSVPAASVAGTYLVQAFDSSTVLMFTVPCAVGGIAVLLFTWRLPDRHLAPAGKPPWSLRELAGTFYVSPRRNPDFAWAFLSRFLLVTAYAFLVTYQAYFLIAQLAAARTRWPGRSTSAPSLSRSRWSRSHPSPGASPTAWAVGRSS